MIVVSVFYYLLFWTNMQLLRILSNNIMKRAWSIIIFSQNFGSGTFFGESRDTLLTHGEKIVHPSKGSRSKTKMRCTRCSSMDIDVYRCPSMYIDGHRSVKNGNDQRSTI